MFLASLKTVRPASPLDPDRRGRLDVLTARQPEKTVELYQKLRRKT